MNVSLVVGEQKSFAVSILRPDLTPDDSYRNLSFPSGENHAFAPDGSSKVRIVNDVITVRGLGPSPIGMDGTADVTTYTLTVETRVLRDKREQVLLSGGVVRVRVLDPAASNFVFVEI